jgi:hypothetical protein
MSSSPVCGIFLILGFAVAIPVVPRFGRYLSRRRASRLGMPTPIASGAIDSVASFNPDL